MLNNYENIFDSIESENLSSVAVKQILNLIINKTLKPGDKIPTESELCKIMNISRGTLREALKSLENLGLNNVHCLEGRSEARDVRKPLRQYRKYMKKLVINAGTFIIKYLSL